VGSRCVYHEVGTDIYTEAVVQCTEFSRWNTERSWREDRLGVMKWRGVGVCLFGTSVWQRQLYRPVEM